MFETRTCSVITLGLDPYECRREPEVRQHLQIIKYGGASLRLFSLNLPVFFYFLADCPSDYRSREGLHGLAGADHVVVC